jgi:hypothetical protein
MTEAGRWIGFVALICGWRWLFSLNWLQSVFLAALCIGIILFLIHIALELRDIKKRLL